MVGAFSCLEKSGLFYAHFYGRRYLPWLTESWVLLSRLAGIPPNYKQPLLDILKENIDVALADDNTGELEKINAILDQKQKELVRIAHAKKDYMVLADEIEILRDKKQEILVQRAETEGVKKRISELSEFLQNTYTELTEYDEQIVRR